MGTLTPTSQKYEYVNGRFYGYTTFAGGSEIDAGADIFYVSNSATAIVGTRMSNGGTAPTLVLESPKSVADDATTNGLAKITRTVPGGTTTQAWTVITDHGVNGLGSYAKEGQATT